MPSRRDEGFSAVVGVRAEGFAAEQSPTTQHSVTTNILSS